MICYKCGGTGEYLGQGMMMATCDVCSDSHEKYKGPALENIDRKSKGYLDAIKKIMALNPKMSRTEAIKLFEKTYDEV